VELHDRTRIAQLHGIGSCRNRKSRATFLGHAVTTWRPAPCLAEVLSCRKPTHRKCTMPIQKLCRAKSFPPPRAFHNVKASVANLYMICSLQAIAQMRPPAGDSTLSRSARHPDLHQEQPRDRREDGKKNGARPDHIGEEARHLHAGAPRDGINHEIRRIADIGIGAHEHRAE
jgi:hypothetical protein